MNPLGTLEPVNIRDVWQGEASHFTPWLAREENLEPLAEALSMSLEPLGTETPVGPFFADIVCRNPGDGSTVFIENQLERTNARPMQDWLSLWKGVSLWKGAMRARMGF